MDDPFTSLGQEINRTVQKVLDPKNLEDLGAAIHNTVRRTTQKVAEGAKRASEGARAAAENARQNAQEPSSAADAGSGQAQTPPYSYYQTPPASPSSQPAYAFLAYAPRGKAGTPGRVSSVLLIVFGFLGGVPLAILSLIFWGIALAGFSRYMVTPAAVLTLLTLVFMVMILCGFSIHRRVQRFTRYQAVIQGRSFCEIAELAAATGRDAGFVVKAFGLFQNNQMIFIIVAFLASIYGIYYLSKNNTHILCKTGIILIVSGAIGNLIDRVRLGFVVDYFDFRVVWEYVFNMADVFVVCGTIILCIYIMFEEKLKG